MKKLYIVKREVIAESIEEALKKKGKVYEISEATIAPNNNSIGFNVK